MRALLIAVARAGTRLVAVGDHGIIVISDDEGTSWQQAAEVPTQSLLTGVCFLDAHHGVAVGHDEVVLMTTDSGRRWQRTHYAPEAQRPLLDVWCSPRGRVIAVGAYSTYLSSQDGGSSWKEFPFRPAPLPGARASARLTTPGAARRLTSGSAEADAGEEAARGGYHLNRIVSGIAGRLYIAGEAGHLYRSDDEGESWRSLASPYEGSFFGALSLGATNSGESVLAFGLRGNLFRSDDSGASWQRIESGTDAMLDGAARLANGTVAVVGLSGVVLVSDDGAHSFSLLSRGDHAGLAAAAPAGGTRLVVVGEDGARLIALKATPSTPVPVSDP